MSLREDLKKKLWEYEDNLHLEELVDEAADQILALISQKLPEELLHMEISGVAMPRREMDKISIQDLRLALRSILGEKL